MVSAFARVVYGFGCGLLAACSALRPEDVPEPAAATAAAATTNDAERAQRFPGAEALLRGLDFAGERQLRDGDTLLFGVTVHDTAATKRWLLRLVVERDDPELKTTLATMRRFADQRVVMQRPTRELVVALQLFDGDGRELAQSRLQTMDLVLESSFVAAVQALRRGDQDQEVVVRTQLAEIARLLANDPVLKRLLAEVASVPLDLRLLWRRELSLQVYCDKATEVVGAGALAVPTPARFDLPFDLFLNDSLLVRLSAAVAEPHGPTAAVGGIVRLLAQQADRPDRQLTLELLAAARGPRSEFAAHGAAAFLGTSDEGVGLAFSPDGHWLALPGPLGTVELRDLRLEDPSVPCRLLGAFAPVGALHFLDARTLLVARGSSLECFDCTNARAGDELQPAATIVGGAAERGRVLAIEPAGDRAVFVGWAGAEVERWTFAEGLEPVQREPVRPATVETMAMQLASGVQTEVRMRNHSVFGWLLGGPDADRCLVRWQPASKKPAVDAAWRREANGTWTEQVLPALEAERELARSDRRRVATVAVTFDEVAFGTMLARPRQGSAHAAVAGVVSLTTVGTRLLGTCHSKSEFVHGFSPDGRFYAYCAAGHRVLAKVPPSPADASATK